MDDGSVVLAVMIRVGGVQENGIQHGRRRSDGHVRPRRRPSEGGILGGILRPMDDGTVTLAVRIRVDGVQENRIQHGRRWKI